MPRPGGGGKTPLARARPRAVTFQHEDAMAKIKVKTLVIGGEKDGVDFPRLAKHIADTIPGAELVILPNLGHVPHLEAPDAFYPPLLQFLR